MDSFDAFDDKEFEQLNDAILKAIISSKDVEKVLLDFKSKELINEMAVVNLILSLEELSGLMLSGQPNKQIDVMEPLDKNQPTKKTQAKRQISAETKKTVEHEPFNHYLIDGKLLSRNEILFEKYYQGRFNEKQWLKQVKIKR